MPSTKKSGKGLVTNHEAVIRRKRGQQKGSQGMVAQSDRIFLWYIEEHDLSDEQKVCANCRLPYHRKPALDESGNIIEVKVEAYTRTIKRPAISLPVFASIPRLFSWRHHREFSLVSNLGAVSG